MNADKLYSNYLDIIIGFGGHETMPHDVQPFVNGFVEKVAIHRMGGENALWQMVVNALISYPTTVITNSVVVIYVWNRQWVIYCQGNWDAQSRAAIGVSLHEMR